MLYWNFPKRLRFSDPPSNVANPILKTLSPIIIFSPDISWPTFGSRPSRASSYEHVAWAPKVWGKIGKSTLSRPTKKLGAMGEFAEVQYKSSENREMFRCHMCFSSKKRFTLLQPSTPDTPVQGFSAMSPWI
jgi:hypothetical protein